MTRAKFTPWRLDHAGLIVLGTPPKSWKPTPQHPQFIICQPHLYVSTDRETQKEIAALIAAAPAMYAALEASQCKCEWNYSDGLERANEGVQLPPQKTTLRVRCQRCAALSLARGERDE